MQISNSLTRLKIWLVPALFSLAALSVFAEHALVVRAKEASKRAIQMTMAEDPFAVETSASGPLHDLYVSARKGDLNARLQLAKRYVSGDGVAKNEARAFSYFRAIADQYSQIDPHAATAAQVSEAFRCLAAFYRSGVAAAKVKPDANYAANLLHYAASYFGDQVSQFELAQMMLEGKGVAKNPRIAIQWLQNARRKGYVPAQALLGSLLWRGDGVQRLPGEGLGLLALAHASATPETKAWIDGMYEAALEQASASDILEANAFIAMERGGAGRMQAANGLLIQSEPDAKAVSVTTASIAPTPTPSGAPSSEAVPVPVEGVQPVVVSVADDKASSVTSVDLNDLPVAQRRFFNIRASIAKNVELPAEPVAPVRYGASKDMAQPQ